MRMLKPHIFGALSLSSAMLLAACDPKPPSAPKPVTSGIGVGTGSGSGTSSGTLPTMGAAGDASVPPAGAVFSATENSPQAAADAAAKTAATTPAAPTRSIRAMSRAEESAAMPMAGQNNDHSAPAAASAPTGPTTGTTPRAKL